MEPLRISSQIICSYKLGVRYSDLSAKTFSLEAIENRELKDER